MLVLDKEVLKSTKVLDYSFIDKDVSDEDAIKFVFNDLVRYVSELFDKKPLRGSIYGIEDLRHTVFQNKNGSTVIRVRFGITKNEGSVQESPKDILHESCLEFVFTSFNGKYVSDMLLNSNLPKKSDLFESTYRYLSDRLLDELIIHVNKEELNKLLVENKPNSASYFVQFDISEKRCFIKSIICDRIIWGVSADFFKTLSNNKLIKQYRKRDLSLWEVFYGFSNIILYVQFSSHEYYKDYMPRKLTSYEFKNIRTLISKTSGKLDLNKRQHSNLLYELNEFELSVFELEFGEYVGRVRERSYVEVLKIDVRTSELKSIPNPRKFKVLKDTLIEI